MPSHYDTDLKAVRQAITEEFPPGRPQRMGALEWFQLLKKHVDSYLARDGMLFDHAQEERIAVRVQELSTGTGGVLVDDGTIDELELEEVEEHELRLQQMTTGVTMTEGFDGEFFGPGYTASGGIPSVPQGRVFTMAELQPHVQSMLPAVSIGAGALAVVLRSVGSAVGSTGNVVRKVLGGRLGLALGGWELFDLATPGDLPSPLDIPQALWDLFTGAGGRSGDLGWATAQHGPVVKEWIANGTPFVLFMDGWQAAQKRTGAWKFWKAKKPLVYVPGGPMSRKTARRLASLYIQERNRAKKDFGLVNPRTRTS